MRKMKQGGAALAAVLVGLLGVGSVSSQVIVGSQDFSITVENASDTTPDAFTFSSVLNAEPNTAVTSNPVTITGIDTVVPVSVSGSGSPVISLDGGNTWVTSGEISEGGTLQVRLTSGPLFYSGSPFNTTRTATVQVGTGSASFFVQNRSGDTTPDPFLFASTSGSPINSVIVSAATTITGIEAASPVTVSGAGSPEISIAGGAWVTSGTVENNQEIRVRMTSPRTYETVRSATVSVGGVGGVWSLTTADCVTADLSSLAIGQGTCYNNLEVVNAGPGIITVGTVGAEYPNWAGASALCAALGSEWSLPPGSSMTGTGSINVNRDVGGVKAVLDQSSSSTYWTATSGQTVTLGPLPQILNGVNGSASAFCFTQFWLTAQFTPSEYVPDPFTILSASGSPGTLVTSAPITISGLAPGRSVQMVVSGGAEITPTFSINGGAFSGDARSVTNGDSVTFRALASQFNGAQVVLTAQTRDPSGTVNRTATFTVTATAPASELVDTFAFNWQYFPQTYFGTFPGDIYSSEIITLSGGTGNRALRVLESSGYYNSGSLNRWPRIYGSRIYYKNTNVTITTSLTDDANAVMWSTANTNYPDIVTDVGRTMRLKFAPANQSNEAYSVFCVGATCSEYIWTNSATRTDPRAASPFDIVDLTGAATGTLYTSAPFTVTWAPRTAGVQPPNIPISVSGTGSPEYRINGGAWTNVAGWVRSGSTVEVRQTSAATNGTDRVATLSVGTTTSTYVVRTQDIVIPDAFALAAATGSAPNTQITSSPVTITGISTAVPVSVSGEGNPLLSVNGGDWVSEATVGPSGQVRVRLTSASAYEVTRSATLNVNGVTGNFAVTTAPFTFAVASATNVALSSLVTSEPVTMPAFLSASAISVNGDGAPSYSLNGGVFTTAAGTITAGDVLRVRQTSAGTKDTARVATVTIGTATAGFSVLTLPPEACETGAVGSVCSDGAIYAGVANGNKIFVAPASEAGTYAYMTSNNATLGAKTQDGLVNAWAMQVAGISQFPAAQVCAARGAEWVLPAEAEMTVMRNNRASMPAGTFSHTSAWYWTSTESASLVAYAPTSYLSGTSTSSAQKTTTHRVHCIRYSREAPRPAVTDPCADSPAVGALCADNTVYAGLSNGKRVFFETRHSGTVAWKTTGTYTPGTISTTDAIANRLAMEMSDGLAAHPAQQVCANKGASSTGSLWYLPARGDLAMLASASSQGVIAQMYNSSAIGFVSNAIWSSTQSSTSPTQASYIQKNGSFADTATKTASTTASVLCMRYEEPQVYTDPCAGSPSVGAFCSDGTLYAGALDGRQLRIKPVTATFNQKTTSTLTLGTVSSDGLVNTLAMEAAGLNLHPAADACRALGPEFYLPSIEELRVIRSGTAPQGVVGMTLYHWSSSELPNGVASASAYRTYMNGGSELTTFKANASNVLCVSNGSVRTPADPCSAASPVVGSLCSDGSVYFGTISGRKLFTTKTDAGTFALSTSTAANAATTNLSDGRVNMAGMVGTAYPAANACRALGADWYLPARDELAVLSSTGTGLAIQQSFGSTGNYWSSTQNTTTSSNWRVDLTGGLQGATGKTTALSVRCIRTE